MPRQFALAVLAFALFVVSAAADPGGYQLVDIEMRQVGALTVTEKTIQVGDDPAARFTLHRMAKENAARRGALLMMPGGAPTSPSTPAGVLWDDTNYPLFRFLHQLATSDGFWASSRTPEGLNEALRQSITFYGA